MDDSNTSLAERVVRALAESHDRPDSGRKVIVVDGGSGASDRLVKALQNSQFDAVSPVVIPPPPHPPLIIDSGPVQAEARALADIKKPVKEKAKLLPVMEAHLFPYAKQNCRICNGTGQVSITTPGVKKGTPRACNCAYKKFRKERTDTTFQDGRLYYLPAKVEKPSGEGVADSPSGESSPDAAAVKQTDPVRREMERMSVLQQRHADLKAGLVDDLARLSTRKDELIFQTVTPLKIQHKELAQKAVELNVSVDQSQIKLVKAGEALKLTQDQIEVLVVQSKDQMAEVTMWHEEALQLKVREEKAIADGIALETPIHEAELAVEKEINRMKVKGDVRDREREVAKLERRIEKIQVQVKPSA